MTTRACVQRLSECLEYSVRRYWVDEFLFRQVSALPAKSTVLDLGGFRSARRGEFHASLFDLRTIYANLTAKYDPDVLADAQALPFREASFDACICSEVLEHVFDPAAVLKEVARILKSQGCLLISVPFLFRIHGDPEDYGRYTDSYWRTVLQKAGFSAIAIEKQGFFFSVLADFVRQYCSDRPRKGWKNHLLRHLAHYLQRWALRRERAGWVQNDPFLTSFTTGFGIVARKLPHHDDAATKDT